MNERRIREVMPADETEREREMERGRGSKWFATLQGLAVKTTSQSQTMSITDIMSTFPSSPCLRSQASCDV